MQVLMVEDDAQLAKLTAEYLEKNGFSVVTCSDGPRTLAALTQDAYELVLLDLTLPGMDGIELARRIRERWVSLPIIMVTARGQDSDRIAGLELGADDYLPKPFNPRELLARVRAVLRRVQGRVTAGELTTGGLCIDFGAREVRLGGKRLQLTSLEFDLLGALAKNAGRVLSREQLLDLVKGSQADDTFERSVDILISRLRRKIEPNPREPRYVKTVRGVGYMLGTGEPT